LAPYFALQLRIATFNNSSNYRQFYELESAELGVKKALIRCFAFTQVAVLCNVNRRVCNMIDKLTSALQFQQQTLALRQQRQETLAGNIANADTPNYKARDFDFTQELKRATAHQQGAVKLATTHAGHLPLSTSTSAVDMKYRVPAQSRLDGNTVDMDMERAQFLDNSLRYQADIQFLDDRISGLRKAMQPEQ
jgi:flagellar basal-body rod protein FlgB